MHLEIAKNSLDWDVPLCVEHHNLLDVIDWLKKDAYILLLDKRGDDRVYQAFHRCQEDIKNLEQLQCFLDSHRIVVINVSLIPEAFGENGWGQKFEGAGFKRCKCELLHKYLLSPGAKIPYLTQLGVGIKG